MSKLNKELLEVIQQNLSGQVAGELANVLKEWEELKESLPVAKKLVIALQKTNDEFAKQLNKVQVKNEKLEKEAKEVQDQKRKNESDQRNLKIDLMAKELQMIQESKTEIFELVDKVFSVPTVTISNEKTILRNTNVPEYQTMVSDTENNKTTTKTSK